MTKETYSLLEQYMLSCMEDSAHDKEHIYRVLYNALEIAKDEKKVDFEDINLIDIPLFNKHLKELTEGKEVTFEVNVGDYVEVIADRATILHICVD